MCNQLNKYQIWLRWLRSRLFLMIAMSSFFGLTILGLTPLGLTPLGLISECHSSDYLLFFEAQGIAGYSKQEDKMIWYSKTSEDVMQKPSVGFDYIQKFSGETSDFGSLAIQARLAYDDHDKNDDWDKNIELQLYNAYFKYKYSGSDIWLGHNRPALGISSYFDTHGLLLTNLSMNGFGFDRDWGIGAYRELDWGDVTLSLTTGSGMPIYFQSNYLASARVSKGSLNQDNYNIGLSFGHGDTLHTMGYELMMDKPEFFSMAAMDASYLWDNFEARLEFMGGRNRDKESYAVWGRFGINLMDEGRLKFEVQPIVSRTGSDDNYEISLGTSYVLTSDITLRTMYDYDHNMDDHKIIFQLYYYNKI
ncbi:MAG: hypothetical protein HQK67_07655 [Desulfamplus sp.]|nr:hypothetical protein [Desulfamplus sp.]